jgi:uncharacterized OB-fold protein
VLPGVQRGRPAAWVGRIDDGSDGPPVTETVFVGGPVPMPGPDDRQFWESCRRLVLSFQHCGRCEVARHPPSPRCGACGSSEITWRATAGRATVYSYTIVHHAMHDSAIDRLPYVVVLAEFADIPGVRLATNLVGGRRLDVAVGDDIDLVWSDPVGGWPLPLMTLSPERTAPEPPKARP